MLNLITRLFDSFHSQGLVYCHWKSNRNLEKALNGEEDLDLLISRDSVDGVNMSLISLGFKMASQPAAEQSYSIYHYYGLDEESGKLVHPHVHYRLVTGGSILKNYRFPMEEKIFSNREQISGIYVPAKAVELLLLVVRKTLESASITETFMLLREKESVQKEIEWLLREGGGVVHGESGALGLFQSWFPGIEGETFLEALENLRGRWNVLRLLFLGRHMASGLKQYALYPKWSAVLLRGVFFFQKVLKRLVVRRRTHAFHTGGTIIAVVGPDATGKSTVVDMLSSWLSEHYMVCTVHAGRPPSSVVTWLPNKIMPLLRSYMPRYRTGNIEAEVQEKGGSELKGIRLSIFILRSLMIAFDRMRLLTGIYRQATRGGLVICDRYPTPVLGAMDSVQVDKSLDAVAGNRLFRFLAENESMMYRRMPPPDVVVQLTVPVETALVRNESRDKDGAEDEKWVRRRHKQSELQRYPESRTFLVDTSQSLDDTLLKIKRLIWSNL